LAASATRVLAQGGTVATTVEPVQNWSSSSALTTSAPSRSSSLISSPSTATQWLRVDALFSDSTWAEPISSSYPSATITNWLMVDVEAVLAPVRERPRPDWMGEAKCLGSCAHNSNNLFYADHQHNGQVQEAKAVCLGTHPDHPGRCPVLDQCLDYALENGEKWGVWGGCSERERRRIRRQRRRDAAIATGRIVSITAATTSYRWQPQGPPRNQQAGNPAPWGYSKILVRSWRRFRQEERRTASL
jgi:WhiB family transcriptional regulator, redox-sensing transcriptional regulator